MEKIINRLTGPLKSTRSTVVILLALGLTAGLFSGVITSDIYSNAAMLALGAYFGKRDAREEQI